ncbi:RagB/SusD family nutrient uptake outer membrane protein [Polaribacter sp. Q13]|uniref:RagB/SusD family nutrient uptake outer membrane protein n=1 Tax=Polaribacter sp. Q13 TaxID=2806551 RepID=UPI00193B75CE|nr:RagB/SusD family nutrient uptake outer membrane protein [Polaribacter sp. Q13]QVY66871.1 RagB/SusD family nutrient uptake outer membrane protein [Polaribacter sp. Q13]
MKYIKTCLVIFSFVLLNNCDNFLEVDQIGKSAIPVFFSDMDGFRAALPGAYSTVYEYYGEEFVLYPDVAADMLQVNTVGDNSMISQYNYNSNPQEEITAVGGIWTGALEALVNVNNILEYAQGVLVEYPESEDEMAIIKAQALFLRALIHFDLVRIYAQPFNFTADASHIGIPVLLKTPSSDDNVARNTVAEVYAQVIKDLKEAEALFGTDTSIESSYFASKKAVHGLLARVYLYMENWTEAVNYSTLAINSTPLSEGDDYLDLFLAVQDKDESLFKLNGKLKTPELIDFYNLDSPLGYAGNKLMTLLKENPEDLRLQLLDDSTLGTLKYIKKDISIADRYYNIIVLRTSEMYLIRAEANNNLNNMEAAIADIKTLQARNYQKDISEISILENTKETVSTLIDNERAKELSFEGHRLYDLTRTKQDMVRDVTTTSSVKEVLYPSSLFVLPIPQKEMDVNTGMIQNEDY